MSTFQGSGGKVPDGKMVSDDPQIHGDIDRTLNLNHSTLKRARKGVLDAAISQRSRYFKPEQRSQPGCIGAQVGR